MPRAARGTFPANRAGRSLYTLPVACLTERKKDTGCKRETETTRESLKSDRETSQNCRARLLRDTPAGGASEKKDSEVYMMRASVRRWAGNTHILDARTRRSMYLMYTVCYAERVLHPSHVDPSPILGIPISPGRVS